MDGYGPGPDRLASVQADTSAGRANMGSGNIDIIGNEVVTGGVTHRE